MKMAVLTTYALISTVLASSAAPTLPDWRGQLPPVFGDVSIISERAKRGDVRAQVQLANSLTAQFQLGGILINGARCSHPNQRVAPRPMEGVRWTCAAATNSHAGACRNMALARENGSGVK